VTVGFVMRSGLAPLLTRCSSEEKTERPGDRCNQIDMLCSSLQRAEESHYQQSQKKEVHNNAFIVFELPLVLFFYCNETNVEVFVSHQKQNVTTGEAC
jgi:hypothetical protein